MTILAPSEEPRTPTWGPRWHSVPTEGGGLHRLVLIEGTAAQPGGTWPWLALTTWDVFQTSRFPARRPLPLRPRRGTGGPPDGDEANLTPAQLRDLIRGRDARHRVAARLAATPTRWTTRPPDAAAAQVTAADVRAYRKRERLSQRDLAAQAGVQRSVIAETERGRRPVSPTLAVWLVAASPKGAQAQEPG